MLKKYFIPLILILAIAAIAIYFFTGRTTKTRDMRIAVPVEHFSLSNGLKVVVMPNDRIPVVTHMLMVRAGAADDPHGKTGLAHYLEHLLFNGTKNFPEGMYERSVARVGGEQNAYTTRDYTLYYATVPKEHLPMVMTMEADRIANLDFDASKVARELKIITEERNMRIETSPVAQWVEQLDALTFLNHPYHKPLIGWAEDMATLTQADALDFFNRYYRPSNMVLVVAGDVTARDVRRYAQRYYGGLPAGEAGARTWPKEPPIRMSRKGEMQDPRVNEPRLLQQYIAPSAIEGTTTDALPLAVFAHYLGGGDTSALYDALVRQQQVATSVSAEYDPLAIGPGLLRIIAIPAPDITLPQLEEALERELTRILTGPLDAAALARAKTLLKAEVIFAQDGLQPLANIMAELYAIGLDEQYFYNWQDSIEQVSDAAALSAARAVINPKRKVTGYLLPAAVTAPAAMSPGASTPPALPTTEVPHAP